MEEDEYEYEDEDEDEDEDGGRDEAMGEALGSRGLGVTCTCASRA